MEKRQTEFENQLNDTGGEDDSFEEPDINIDSPETDEPLLKGLTLKGSNVYLKIDKDLLPVKVVNYNKNSDTYTVKSVTEKKSRTKIKWEDLLRDPKDWTTDVPESFIPIKTQTSETASVEREYDRIKIENANSLTSLQLFFSFLPLKFWQVVVRESNKYAKNQGGVDLGLTLPELMRWIALTIIWGIWSNLPSPRSMWSSLWIFNQARVTNIMTSKRFLVISCWLHIADNQRDDKSDNFFKIRRMSDALNRTSSQNYVPHRELSFDEMSPGSSHRTHLTKRTKHKKVPSAIDVKALCDGHTSYHIQHRLSCQPCASISGLTVTGSQVIDLLQGANIKSYSEIFFDNLYSCVALFVYIWKHFCCYATGTWRVNYGVPSQLLRSKVSVSQIASEQDKIEVMAYNTSDLGPPLLGIALYGTTKPFYMLTSGGYELIRKIGGLKSVLRFDIQHSFNQFMNGVDVNDQLQGSYATYMKSMKWWKRLFFFFLEIAIINSYIIRNIISDITHLTFRIDLVDQIMLKYPVNKKRTSPSTPCNTTPPPKKRMKPTTVPPIRLEDGPHFPKAIDTQ